MDEQNQQQALPPQQPPIPPQNINPMPPPQQSLYGKINWLKWVLIIVFVALLASITTYFVLTFQSQKPPPPQIVQTIPSPTPDLYTEGTRSATANWKTYTNIKYGYLIKYPSDVKLEPSTEEAIGFYRNEVAKSGTGGQGRCCGMTIYSRTYDSVSIESQSRPIETINVGGYSALRWSDDPPFFDDIWIPNPDKRGAVRITISTLNAIDPYNKEDYEIFEQILSTFRFTQ